MKESYEPQFLLQQEDADLYAKIGRELSGSQAFPISRREAIVRGRKWMDSKRDQLASLIFNDQMIEKIDKKELTLSERVMLVDEILDIVTDAVVEVEPVLVAVILVREGLPMKVRTILILAANPKNTPQLRLDEEVREISNGLQRAQRRNEFELKQQWAVRPVDVRRAMLDHNPQIVHFCGHGEGEEGIILEDETGKPKFISAEALSGFFELFSENVECVLLNACYSKTQAEAIGRHIKYVIGMKKGISDDAAIKFSVAFYDALGAGRSVEFAFKLACNAIQWAGLPDHLAPIIKRKFQNEIKAT